MHLFPDATPKRGEVALRPPSELAVIAFPENFGEDILNRGLALSGDITSQSLSTEASAFNDVAGSLLLVVKEFDPARLASAGRFFGWVKASAGSIQQRLRSSFSGFEHKADQLLDDLKKRAEAHRKRDGLLGEMFESNARNYRELDARIAEGRALLEEARRRRTALPAPADGYAAQMLAQGDADMDRFEKRLHDLDISLTLFLQTGAQLQKMRQNGRALVEKFETLSFISMRAFRDQFTLYLLQSEQEKSIAVGNAMDEATNAAIRRNAELLHQNSVAVARSVQRNAVDFETLAAAHNEILAAFEEGRREYVAADARRAEEKKGLSALRDAFVQRLSNKE